MHTFNTLSSMLSILVVLVSISQVSVNSSKSMLPRWSIQVILSCGWCAGGGLLCVPSVWPSLLVSTWSTSHHQLGNSFLWFKTVQCRLIRCYVVYVVPFWKAQRHHSLANSQLREKTNKSSNKRLKTCQMKNAQEVVKVLGWRKTHRQSHLSHRLSRSSEAFTVSTKC